MSSLLPSLLSLRCFVQSMAPHVRGRRRPCTRLAPMNATHARARGEESVSSPPRYRFPADPLQRCRRFLGRCLGRTPGGGSPHHRVRRRAPLPASTIGVHHFRRLWSRSSSKFGQSRAETHAAVRTVRQPPIVLRPQSPFTLSSRIYGRTKYVLPYYAAQTRVGPISAFRRPQRRPPLGVFAKAAKQKCTG